MHGMLEKVLEDNNHVPFPWAISRADLIPPSTVLVASLPDPPNSRSTSSLRGTRVSRLSGSSGSGSGWIRTPPSPQYRAAPRVGPLPRVGPPPEAPSTLVGASGALPPQLAEGGRWFARAVTGKAILLTFLPALDVWRKEVAARLERRKERRARKQHRLNAAAAAAAARMGRDGKQGKESKRTTGEAVEGSVGNDEKQQAKKESNGKSEGKTGEEAEGSDGDNDNSLGIFLYLVRWGDFGLPIEPQSAMLRDVRRILLAHIPQSHHRAMEFRPAQRCVLMCCSLEPLSLHFMLLTVPPLPPSPPPLFPCSDNQ